jgi:SAM-dependent methyltransferase
LENLTNTIKAGWEDLHSNTRFLPKYQSEHVIRFAFSQFGDCQSREKVKILDLGCGGGRHCAFLAQEGYKVYGTDISLTGLHATKTRLRNENKHGELAQADMLRLPFLDNSFDGLIAYGTLYYASMEEMISSINEVRRILRVDGKALMILRTPNDFRYGKGTKIDSNSFVLSTKETNEFGMKMCFLDSGDIHIVFAKFKILSVEKTETTHGNQTVLDSDWIITIQK